MKQNLLKIFFVVIPILLLGIYYGYTTFFLCLTFIILRLSLTSKQTAGFYLILFGGLIAGLTRALVPSLPIYGLVLNVLGLYLLLSDFKGITTIQRNGLLALLSVFFIFFLSYLFAKHTPYANRKMWEIVQNGLFLFFGYYVFDKSKSIDSEALVQLLLLSTISFIVFTIEYYNLSRGNFFDYEWYRHKCVLLLSNDQASMLVDYQTVGVYAAFAAALYLSCVHLERWKVLFYIPIAAQLIMTSGCRQAILALIVICFLRMALFKDSKTSLGHIFFMALACIFVYIFINLLQNSNIEFIRDTIESGDQGRNLIYIGALNIISTHTAFGVGLGGFPLYVDASWPHNIILEILCECGVVGFFAILFIVIVFINNNKISIKHRTASESYLFLFLAALGVRVLVSGDLKLSIELFSALFACSKVIENQYHN